jgi:uncharacterized protein
VIERIVDSGAAPAAAPAAEREARLRAAVRALGSCVVAYSGGVDSSVVLAVARAELGERALAVIGRSATYAGTELDAALAQAARLGVTPRVIATAELDDPRFAGNPANRCYFCKGELYGRLATLAEAEGYAWIVDGTNADDGRDYRPGTRAAHEHRVRSPLADCGFGKADVRALAARLGLPSADKPAMPCLSSRFPYGATITPEKLRQVEQAEAWLRARGLRDVRVRHHGAVARLEVELAELPRLAAEPLREDCVRALKALGFVHVAVDLAGFRSGSLNEALPLALRRGEAARRAPRTTTSPDEQEERR